MPAPAAAQPIEAPARPAAVDKTLQREPPPARRAPVRPIHPAPPAPRPAIVKAKKSEDAPPPTNQVTPEVAPAAADKSDDCNPPYYFEGRKKVFKTNCI